MLPGVALADAADAVLMGEIVGHRFHREQIGFAAELAGSLDHLLQAARRIQHQFVRQHHRERLVADDVARAPDRVAEAERRLLAGEARGAGLGLVARQNVLLGLLVAARGERGVELEHPVEMILDHALVAPGDEDEMLDAGFLGLVDHILDQRLVDDGQHFLRHRLGGGQDAGAETGDREDGFADFHGMIEGLGNEELWERGKCFDCTLVAGLHPATKADVWCQLFRLPLRWQGATTKFRLC